MSRMGRRVSPQPRRILIATGDSVGYPLGDSQTTISFHRVGSRTPCASGLRVPQRLLQGQHGVPAAFLARAKHPSRVPPLQILAERRAASCPEPAKVSLAARTDALPVPSRKPATIPAPITAPHVASIPPIPTANPAPSRRNSPSSASSVSPKANKTAWQQLPPPVRLSLAASSPRCSGVMFPILPCSARKGKSQSALSPALWPGPPDFPHRQRPLRTPVHASLAQQTIRIEKHPFLRLRRREKSEWTRLCAKTALHASPAHPNPASSRTDRLVNLPHGTHRAPKMPVERQPTRQPNPRRNGNHRVKQPPPPQKRRRPHPRRQSRDHCRHHGDRCLPFQQESGQQSPRVRQQGIKRPARAEISASVPPTVPHRAKQPHRHVQHQAIRQNRITPPQSQHRHERHRFDSPLHLPPSDTLRHPGRLAFHVHSLRAFNFPFVGSFASGGNQLSGIYHPWVGEASGMPANSREAAHNSVREETGTCRFPATAWAEEVVHIRAGRAAHVADGHSSRDCRHLLAPLPAVSGHVSGNQRNSPAKHLAKLDFPEISTYYEIYIQYMQRGFP